MLILTLRTDKPESEIGLFDDLKQIVYFKWQAHYELAETIHTQVSNLLKDANESWHKLEGIVAYKGPGSFTGLRIGVAFANTLSYSLKIPIIGSKNEDWVNDGISKLMDSQNEEIVIPEYGADAHITVSKK